MECDYLIVGAGFFGSVIAERIGNDLNSKVIIIDKRTHIGGNCYSEIDKKTGIEVHKYGTHIFHTSLRKVWDYISNFSEFNGYHHQVLTTYKNKVYQMPINLETINSFYNLNLKPFGAKELIKNEIEKEGIIKPKNLEEKAISLIGRPLYDAFIKGYTIKHWGKNPKELPASIITRLPVRYNYNEDYFNDARWQGIPTEGYTKIFERLLSSSNIEVKLSCDYFEYRDQFKVKEKVIYTGPIDQYYNNQYGKLEWRAVKFEKAIINEEDFQGTSVMNYADANVKYTRIHEPRHLHPERDYKKNQTVIIYEYSDDDPYEPFYPIRTNENKKILEKYKKLSQKNERVIIRGRLGDYEYYDMDKTIYAALDCYETKIKGNN